MKEVQNKISYHPPYVCRYAYHLRRWALEGQPGLGCHTLGGPVESVRVVIHAGGYNDKICLELATTDYVADLRAEVTHWYLSLGGDKRSADEKVRLILLFTSTTRIY